MKSKTSKKPKRETISSLKKKAWTAFSRYIRLRDGLKTMGSTEYGKCITCGEVVPLWTRGGMQAGHFIDGRSASILFDEDLVHGQCSRCNLYKSGNKDAYTPIMIDRYGLERVQEMWRQKNIIHRWTKEELNNIIQKYNELYKFMVSNNPTHG
jgi:hypothetical protein